MMHNGRLCFATFFPGCNNGLLVKDVGMIPYIMQKDYNYESYMICYHNDEYPYLETEVAGLKMIFLKHNIPLLDKVAKSIKGKSTYHDKLILLITLIDSLIFLLKFGRKIDVLQFYHLKLETILVGFIYRIINQKGILHLKLDISIASSQKEAGFSLRYFIFDLVHFDIISAESEKVYAFLKASFPFFKNCRDRIYYLPDGIDLRRISSIKRPFERKRNVILHAGRIGSSQKGSELALKAFSEICEEFPDWELLLTGSIENQFCNFMNDFLSERPLAAKRISYVGFVERDELYRLYSEAKILLAPSRWESFGLVVAEAGAFGDILIGSDIPPFQDMTDGGKLGYLCPVDNLGCLTERLRYLLSHEEELKVRSDQISEFIKNNFDWKIICGNLDTMIHKLSKNRSEKS
jgi:L-malate glycosyltransferase